LETGHKMIFNNALLVTQSRTNRWDLPRNVYDVTDHGGMATIR